MLQYLTDICFYELVVSFESTEIKFSRLGLIHDKPNKFFICFWIAWVLLDDSEKISIMRPANMHIFYELIN